MDPKNKMFQHVVEQVEDAAPISQPEHRAHLLGRGLASAMGDRLVHQAHRVADRAFGGAGDQ
ncbi:hypothetical protein LCGC14_2779780, partial [marine sediment metagenome]